MLCQSFFLRRRYFKFSGELKKGVNRRSHCCVCVLLFSIHSHLLKYNEQKKMLSSRCLNNHLHQCHIFWGDRKSSVVVVVCLTLASNFVSALFVFSRRISSYPPLLLGIHKPVSKDKVISNLNRFLPVSASRSRKASCGLSAVSAICSDTCVPYLSLVWPVISSWVFFCLFLFRFSFFLVFASDICTSCLWDFHLCLCVYSYH